MFTGIIQGLGQITALPGDRLKISLCPGALGPILSDLAIGDSIAVDGVCLTAEEIETDGFMATVSPETLARSTLGKAAVSATYVNLESSLRVGGKVGGHFVTGHVDGIGALTHRRQTDQAWELAFAPPAELIDPWRKFLGRFLVSKGSITVNGISLTIADCDPLGDWFTVAVIPHTYGETNLQYLELGSWVNLEGDVLAKYVARLLNQSGDHASSEISLDFLAENGYV